MAPSTPLPKTPIDLHAFLGDHTCSTHFLAQKCLIGAWASLLNLSRKGHAEAVGQLGLDIFGKRTFTTALSHALLVCEAPVGAAEGFARIEVKGVMGLHICDDMEMGKRGLVGAWASLLNLKTQEEAEMVKELAVKVYGKEAWEKGVQEAIPQASPKDKKKNPGKENIPPIDPTSQAAHNARFQPQLSLGRTRTQFWAFTAIAQEEITEVNEKANTTTAAAPGKDYGKYCERCGTRNASGVTTEEADAEKKEWVVEQKIKAKMMVAEEQSNVDDTNEVEIKSTKNGATRNDSKDDYAGINNINGKDEVEGTEKATAKDSTNDCTKSQIKHKPIDAGKFCDRCGAEDGAVVGDRKAFWPFHVLDPGKVERVRCDSK